LGEHLIRTWRKFNGTWDVTHHADIGMKDEYLHDVPKDFKHFRTRSLADAYAQKLFNTLTNNGNHVELRSPDTFGQEIKDHKWSHCNAPEIRMIFEEGKLEVTKNEIQPNL
jgi:hypothetical protein